MAVMAFATMLLPTSTHAAAGDDVICPESKVNWKLTANLEELRRRNEPLWASSPPIFFLISDPLRLPLLKALLEEGADPNVCGPFVATPLILAIQTGNKDAVDLLLVHGAGVNGPVEERGLSPLALAISAGQLTIATQLIHAGADPTRVGPMDTLYMLAGTRYDSKTHQLLAEQDVAALGQLLIAHGANPRAVIPASGSTPLMMAVAAGHYELTKVFIESGAAVDAKKRNGDSARDLAVQRADRYMIEILDAAAEHRSARDNVTAPTDVSIPTR